MTFLNILTAIFTVSKIGGLIDWSWWVIFIPTYISILIPISLIIIYIGGIILVAFSEYGIYGSDRKKSEKQE